MAETDQEKIARLEKRIARLKKKTCLTTTLGPG